MKFVAKLENAQKLRFKTASGAVLPTSHFSLYIIILFEHSLLSLP